MQENKELIKSIIDNIKSGDYHLSFSSLSRFAHSPRSYIEYQLNKKLKNRKVTDAMKIGTAIHELFLERKLYSIDVLPTDRPKKPSKTQLEADKPSAKAQKSIDFWSSIDINKCITSEQYEVVEMHVSLCENNNEAHFLREFGQVEIEEKIQYRGFNIVRKLDILGDAFVADLKKCPNAKGYKFRYKVRDELLHLQAAIYLLGRDSYEYKWIAVDGKDCIVHSIGSNALNNGFAYLDYYLDEFKKLLNGKDEDWLKGREYWEKNSIIDF